MENRQPELYLLIIFRGPSLFFRLSLSLVAQVGWWMTSTAARGNIHAFSMMSCD